MTISLINYDNFIDYIYFVILKTAINIIISFNLKISNIKLIISLILEIVEISKDNIYIKIALLR